MPTQERPQPSEQSRRDDEIEEPIGPAPGAAERKDTLDDDVDAILDEIDDVLEENAEEFVRGFVQKGGE